MPRREQHFRFEESVIVRYLLDDLGEEQKTKLEELYFCDSAFFKHVRHIEQQLIASADSLPGRDRELFEQKYLSVPALKARVAAITQGGIIAEEQSKSRSSKFWGFSLSSLLWRPAFAVPVTTAVVLTATFLWWKPHTSPDHSPAAPVASAGIKESGGTLLAMTLSPGIAKNTRQAPHTLVIEQSITDVELTLLLPPVPAGMTVAAELLRVEASGRVPFSVRRGIQPSRSGTTTSAVLRLAASDLTGGDYVVYVRKELQGRLSEPIETFVFSVE